MRQNQIWDKFDTFFGANSILQQGFEAQIYLELRGHGMPQIPYIFGSKLNPSTADFHEYFSPIFFDNFSHESKDSTQENHRCVTYEYDQANSYQSKDSAKAVVTWTDDQGIFTDQTLFQFFSEVCFVIFFFSLIQ